jgi:hypothetical protein
VSQPAGAAPGYRTGRTLTVRAEWRRQAGRRRTQLTLGFMVALPLIVLIAFQVGGGRFASLVDLATTGGLNFTLFTVFVSAGFLLVVVVALFFGDPVASEASWGSLRCSPRSWWWPPATAGWRCSRWPAPPCWSGRFATAGTRCAAQWPPSSPRPTG